MDSGIQFPKTLKKDDQKTKMEGNDDNHHVAKEIDFFAICNSNVKEKKEVEVLDDDSRKEVVDTGLYLSSYGRRGQSTIDNNKISLEAECKQAESKLSTFQMELQYANAEIQKLREMHTALQRRHKTQEVSQAEKKPGDERTQSGSGLTNTHGKTAESEESPTGESVPQGQKPKKISKLKPTSDQHTESIIKNSRVSVLVRSEEDKVQRCAEDRSTVITTYEGTHNHPAAASMIPSGSISCKDGLMRTNPNKRARSSFPFPSSMVSLSNTAPFPTVVIDLTQDAQPSSSQMPPAPSPHLDHGMMSLQQLPQILRHPLYNQSVYSGLQFSQKSSSSTSTQASDYAMQQLQHVPTADIAAATAAAIIADPNFPAILAAARSSIANAQPNNNVTNADSVSASTAAAITADPNFPAMLAATLRSITAGAQPNNNVRNVATAAKGKRQ